jgi:hypothetical protein
MTSLTNSTASGTPRRAPGAAPAPALRPAPVPAAAPTPTAPRRQVRFAGLMQYDGEEKLPKHFLVPPPDIERTTGEYLARGCGQTVSRGSRCVSSHAAHL